MSGTPTRVAMQLGASSVRIAGAERGGEPWLLAEVPADGSSVADLLARFVGTAPEELVLVHPASWPAQRVTAWMDECADLAGRVRAVPAPVAAAGGRPVAVLDVGHAGAEAGLLGVDGSVLAASTAPVGGAILDRAVGKLLGLPAGPAGDAEARRVREALSLLPSVARPAPGGRTPEPVGASEIHAVLAGPLGEAVEALRDVLAGAGAVPVPVLLVGGVARTPLLAELVDHLGGGGFADVAIASRPDAAAVLGALMLPCHPAVPARAAASSGGAAQIMHRLPPPAPRARRPLRAALLGAVAAGVVAGLLAVGTLLPANPTAVPVPAGVLVQYGYLLDVPHGWEHTGGLPERRRTLITPAGAPEGSDLIAVERSPLGYDTGAEPDRARAELRAVFDAAVAGGSALSDYRVADVEGQVEGRTGSRYRPAATYRQRDAGSRTVVDWFVLLDGDAQLSVGCRYTTTAAGSVREACAVVVGSVRLA